MFKAKFEVLFVNGAIGYGAVTNKKLLYHVSNPISLAGPIAHLFLLFKNVFEKLFFYFKLFF
jgi:hypothetical protein